MDMPKVARNPLFVLAVTSLLGTAILYGIVLIGTEPVSISLPDISDSLEGKMVETEGYVADLDEGGRTEIILRDNGTEIPVILEPSVSIPNDLLPGSFIRVTGEVENYDGLRVRVFSPEDINVLTSPVSSSVPLETLLRNPDMFSGLHVNTTGNLSDLREYEDRSRILAHAETEDVWLHYAGGEINLTDSTELLAIYGRAEYNTDLERYEIALLSPELGFLPDNRSDYAAVPVSDILAGKVEEGGEVVIYAYPDREFAGETVIYGHLEDGEYTLSLVAYRGSTDMIRQLEGQKVAVLGVMKYSHYSGTWRITLESAVPLPADG